MLLFLSIPLHSVVLSIEAWAEECPIASVPTLVIVRDSLVAHRLGRDCKTSLELNMDP